MYTYKSLQVCHLRQEHLSFLQNFLNFVITKYLEQEVDNDLSLRKLMEIVYTEAQCILNFCDQE